MERAPRKFAKPSSHYSSLARRDTPKLFALLDTPLKRKRASPEINSSHESLANSPKFKRIRLSGRTYCAPASDGLGYNQLSRSALEIRHYAGQVATKALREELTSLTEEMKVATGNDDQKANEQETARLFIGENKEKLDRASLQARLESAENENERIKRVALNECQKLLDKKSKIVTGKDAVIADLERRLEEERRARVEAEMERSAALCHIKAHRSAEFELKGQIADLVVDNEALRAALERSRQTSPEQTSQGSGSNDECNKPKAELATLKAEFERWRGQTVPPKVIARTQLGDKPRKKQKKHVDPAFAAAHPQWFINSHPALTALGSMPRLPEPPEEQRREWAQVAAKFDAMRNETDNFRDGAEKEYITAQKNFEEGRHDQIPIGRVLHDFMEKEFVKFTKGPDGRIRRAGVYRAMLDPENTSVHMLPVPVGGIKTRRANSDYALWCLTAQLPELQAQAAKQSLSDQDYAAFMHRSFGPDWQKLDLSNKDVEPQEWQKTVNALLEDERFKTACRMWAAGEPALNEDRCWPPTFKDLVKTQSCTQFKNEDERMDLYMRHFPGYTPRLPPPVENDQPDDGER